MVFHRLAMGNKNCFFPESCLENTLQKHPDHEVYPSHCYFDPFWNYAFLL
jgi:hypothetical protein